ncbi:hypothetical protein BTN49_3021 [Candidatus Enterovibrio escicola]|uniref:Uncharacterized protein n=1 Tax=Candidatus Enterovibrio escicola TaxID=1927127 RepID=A0A2A5T014_9GAMM|nr:hypothetical protein BTN49_3021 [Candidatus Enterovibrio escacola]
MHNKVIGIFIELEGYVFNKFNGSSVSFTNQWSITADIIYFNKIYNHEKIYFLEGNQLIEHTINVSITFKS